MLPLLVLISALTFGQTSTEPANKAELQAKLQTAFSAQKFADAIKYGEALLKLDPNDGNALHHVGYSYHALGKLDQALEFHKRGAEQSRFAATCAYNAACVYSLQEKPDDAFAWLDKAISLGFKDVGAFNGDSDFDNIRDDARIGAVRDRMAGKAPSNEGKAPAGSVIYSQPMQRLGTRVAGFGQTGGIGQVAIEYGPVAWKTEYDEQISSGKLDGRRWRLGDNFWTNLAADVPFTLGDKTFQPGDYYLTLERTEGKYLLTLMPPAEARKGTTDAYWAHDTSSGVQVSMNHAAADASADTLSIQLATRSQQSTVGQLTIQFGPHTLTTPFSIKL